MAPKFVATSSEVNGVFLGTIRFGGKCDGSIHSDPEYYDLYWIRPEHNIGHVTLSARWSDEPADYSSGLPFGWLPYPHPLVIARMLAQSYGLDVKAEQYDTSDYRKFTRTA